MKKVVITGPESSGKSILAHELSQYFNCPVNSEFAREYLSASNGLYNYEDLLVIAKGQIDSEEDKKHSIDSPPFYFLDTDLITIKIWSLEKYGKCHAWIEEKIDQNSVDLYLLCKPDIPWEPDPLRENPLDRDRLYDVYKTLLDQLHMPYKEINGDFKSRLQKGIGYCKELSGE